MIGEEEALNVLLAASIYMDSTMPVLQPWLEEIFAFAEQRDLPLLVEADTNCHSVFYGDSTNARGEELEVFLLQHGIEVQNRGTQPTFEVIRNGVTYASCIDATFTRFVTVSDWMVSQKFNGSDHHTLQSGYGYVWP